MYHAPPHLTPGLNALRQLCTINETKGHFAFFEEKWEGWQHLTIETYKAVGDDWNAIFQELSLKPYDIETYPEGRWDLALNNTTEAIVSKVTDHPYAILVHHEDEMVLPAHLPTHSERGIREYTRIIKREELNSPQMTLYLPSRPQQLVFTLDEYAEYRREPKMIATLNSLIRCRNLNVQEAHLDSLESRLIYQMLTSRTASEDVMQFLSYVSFQKSITSIYGCVMNSHFWWIHNSLPPMSTISPLNILVDAKSDTYLPNNHYMQLNFSEFEHSIKQYNLQENDPLCYSEDTVERCIYVYSLVEESPPSVNPGYLVEAKASVPEQSYNYNHLFSEDELLEDEPFECFKGAAGTVFLFLAGYAIFLSSFGIILWVDSVFEYQFNHASTIEV